MSDALTDDLPDDMSKYDVNLTQTQSGWQNEFNFPKNLKASTTEPAKDGTCSFTWNSTNNELTASIKLSK